MIGETAMTPREVFLRLVDGVTGRRYDELPELYAETTDVRHPMSPYGDKPLLSRDDRIVAPAIRFTAENIVVHETADPEVIVAEFDYVGTVPSSDDPSSVSCVFVLRVRDGLIVESRDYVDHVAMAKARGQLDELVTALRA
jgi:ketosteroid isomerase-like protein